MLCQALLLSYFLFNSYSGKAISAGLIVDNKQPHSSSCGEQREFREPIKAGVANIICLTTGFNTESDKCWQTLAEYYYNVVPEPGVKVQKIFFVAVPRGTRPIHTLEELKKSPFKNKTYFVCTYNVDTEKYSFANHPFANK